MDKIIIKKKALPKNLLKIAIISSFIIFVIYFFILRNQISEYNVDKNRVLIKRVKKGNFSDYVLISGNVFPIRTIYLDALQGGQVKELFLEEGQKVKKNDVILKLSNTELQMEIMNREANITDNINNLRNTRINMEQHSLNIKKELLEIDYKIKKERENFKIEQKLFEKEKIAKQQFIKTQMYLNYLLKKKELAIKTQKQDSLFRISQINQLEESEKRMNRNFKMIHNKLNELYVKSPAFGQLSLLNVEIGEAVNKGKRLGRIDILTSYKIKAEIDEFYISKISCGMLGKFEFNDKFYKLKINKIYPEILNGKFMVEMLFVAETPSNLTLGQSFRIKLTIGSIAKSIIIPKGDFFVNNGENWIFVLDKSEKFAVKRKILINRENPNYYEVISGLEPNEKIIVSGYDNFGNVEKINFIN